VTNLLFIGLLTPTLKHAGIALATSLSSWCNSLYLLLALKNLGQFGVVSETTREFTKQLVVSAVMMGSIVVMNIFANPFYTEGGVCSRWVVAGVLLASVCVFIGVGKLWGIFNFLEEMQSFDKQLNNQTGTKKS
jgi:putative peptidoglycan lipid II flippase